MNVQSLDLIVGALLPPVIDFINRHVGSSQLKYIISLVVSVIIGAVLNYQNLDLATVLGSTALVFAAAQSTYKLYWEDSGIRKKMVK